MICWILFSLYLVGGLLVENDNKKVNELIESGTSIVSNVIGGMVGLSVAGPPGVILGAIAGTAIGTVIKRVGNDIYDKFLSTREKMRIGASLTIVSNDVKDKMQTGDEIRNDDFFDVDASGRSAADETLEAVFKAVQESYQENKILFISHLFTSISYDVRISTEYANYLIKTANELTYRQYVILALLGINQTTHRYKLKEKYGRGDYPQELRSILHEIYDLYTKGLISQSNPPLGIAAIDPASLRLQSAGVELFGLMHLSEIPTSDIEKAAVLLS